MSTSITSRIDDEIASKFQQECLQSGKTVSQRLRELITNSRPAVNNQHLHDAHNIIGSLRQEIREKDAQIDNISKIKTECLIRPHIEKCRPCPFVNRN